MNKKEITLKELTQAIKQTIIEQTGQIPGSPNRPPEMGFETYATGKLTEIARKYNEQQNEQNQNQNPKTTKPQTKTRTKQGRGRETKYCVSISQGKSEQITDQNDKKTIQANYILDELKRRSEKEGREGENLRRIGINPEIIEIVRRRLYETK